MRILRQKPLHAWLTIALLLVGGFAIYAAAPAVARPSSPAARASAQSGKVRVELSGSVNRNKENVNVDQTQVTPGEVINWNVRMINGTTREVRNVSAVGEIPKGTAFIPGSAGGDGVTGIEYSADGGQTFSARPTVKVKGEDRPASPDAYTNVRFTWNAPIDAGSAKQAYYRTRVR